MGGLELRFIIIYVATFFLFCAANQYGRIQFNTGVRHIVPVTPFLFLIAAGVLLRMKPLLAVLVGVITTYWSWCLAMYRDVEFGMGIFESLIHITTGGFRLPWLTTLERMGYFKGNTSTIPLFLLLAAILWGLWSVGRPLSEDLRQEVDSVPLTNSVSHPEIQPLSKTKKKIITSS